MTRGDRLCEDLLGFHPPPDVHEAGVESDRRSLCFDTPCTAACPISFDAVRLVDVQHQSPDRAAPRTGRVVSVECVNWTTLVISRPGAA